MKTLFYMLYRRCPINTIRSDDGKLIGFAAKHAGKWYGYPRNHFLSLIEAQQFIDGLVNETKKGE